jgi:hypothetical protein
MRSTRESASTKKHDGGPLDFQAWKAYYRFMKKKHGGARPGSGRPRTGIDPVRAIRLSDEFIANVDAWAAANDTNRSDAFRRLVELGLTVKAKATPASRPGRMLRATELAAKEIDKIADPAAHPEERAERKRRLTKGPEEFREVRVDRPKAKGK